MTFRSLAAGLLAAVIGTLAARADILSYQGDLTSPTDSASGLIVFTLLQSGTVDFQTWGFGGGTNGSGDVISPGGFDPFLSVFSGTGDGATFIDGMSDIFGDSYDPYQGCPPAGKRAIGGLVCGDVHMSLSLDAGPYSVLVTDADYIPAALFYSGTLGDGFFDLTPADGTFQTCVVGQPCATDSAHWALDIKTASGGLGVPEPGPAGLMSVGLLGFGLSQWRHRHGKHSGTRAV